MEMAAKTDNQSFTAQVTVLDQRGLHLRMASEITRICKPFTSKVRLIAGSGKTADARSPLAVMCLAVPHGTRISVDVTGEDAAEALHQLVDFFSRPPEY